MFAGAGLYVCTSQRLPCCIIPDMLLFMYDPTNRPGQKLKLLVGLRWIYCTFVSFESVIGSLILNCSGWKLSNTNIVCFFSPRYHIHDSCNEIFGLSRNSSPSSTLSEPEPAETGFAVSYKHMKQLQNKCGSLNFCLK